jgi:hypothetical protein
MKNVRAIRSRRGNRSVVNPEDWAEYEPFDRAGLKEWTDVYDCDDDDCENRVAVYDPYGTVCLVLCAEHNHGVACAGGYPEPPEPEEEDEEEFWRPWADEDETAEQKAFEEYQREECEVWAKAHEVPRNANPDLDKLVACFVGGLVAGFLGI